MYTSAGDVDVAIPDAGEGVSMLEGSSPASTSFAISEMGSWVWAA